MSDKSGQKEKVKSPVSSTMKIVARVSWIAISITGGVIGFVPCATGYGYSDGEMFLHTLIGLAIGTVAGFLINLILMYLAELGENTRKNANANLRIASQSDADEIAKYHQLYENGVITAEEFEEKKKQLLNQ